MSQIAVYARIRPPPPPTQCYRDLTSANNEIKIKFGVKSDETYSRFAEPHYKEYIFPFKHVFTQSSTQDEVFNTVARHIVDKFLEGYNGTIFAYGQTASGKTYTIEGSARCYNERGLIPRVISTIYKAIEERQINEDITLHISYMEIYQDTGYDLLNPASRTATLSTALPKVKVTEGINGEIYVKNLSIHLATTEQVALNLLFEGSTCRKVAETVMNVSSSRSHTIFTLMLTAQQQGSDTRIRSKLNLVDLAGSERVAKTRVDGQILEEAKYINLSLHHLEHVIVTLQRQARSLQDVRPSSRCASRGFVPYRNSLLTMVLRDSLGGNCLTAMIATVSAEQSNMFETVSTCRFAQRVACVSNKARRNEELDDKAIIRQLKEKIAELENKLTHLQCNEESNQTLTSEDKTLCHKVLYEFLHGRLHNPVAAGINTSVKFQECLLVLRDVILHALKDRKQSNLSSTYSSGFVSLNEEETKEDTKIVPTKPSKSVKSPIKFKREQQLLQSSNSIDQHLLQLSPHQCSPHSKDQVFVNDQHSSHSQCSPHSSDHQSFRYSKDKLSPHSDKDNSSSDSVKDKRSSHSDKDNLSSCSGKDQLSPHSGTGKRSSNNRRHISSTSPEKEIALEIERQSLEDNVTCLKFQLQVNQLNYELSLVSEQLSAQHARVVSLEKNPAGLTMDEVIKERLVEQQLKLKQSKLVHKLSESRRSLELVKSNKRLSPPIGPLQVTGGHEIQDKINQLRLSQFEKQLELKETATRHRLATLKCQLLHNTSTTPTTKVSYRAQTGTRTGNEDITPKIQTTLKTGNEDITTKHNIKTGTMTMISPKTQTGTRTGNEDVRIPQSSEDKTINISLSRETGEKHYTTALQQQKARVTRIRQCIKAAITIQRAWKKYKRS